MSKKLLTTSGSLSLPHTRSLSAAISKVLQSKHFPTLLLNQISGNAFAFSPTDNVKSIMDKEKSATTLPMGKNATGPIHNNPYIDNSALTTRLQTTI
ncbi:hypothetical protein CEXT_86881 [Caerostris extrusa]|uniref:Uncharacterized protein n=1 Tax=Caerostris extrusa TaxID=172846 RepID=A0AAV4SLP6_CAEEX|nr:hypothetical protein CEXT_86881 [Caerostris extrusa]